MATPGSVTPPSEKFYVRQTVEGNLKSISPFWGKFFSTGKAAEFLEKRGFGTVKAGKEAFSLLGNATQIETNEAKLTKLASIWADAIRKGKDEDVAGQDSRINVICNKIFSQPKVVAAYSKREKLPKKASREEIVKKMKELEKQPISFRIAALRVMLVLTSNVANRDMLVETLNFAMSHPKKAADILAQAMMIVKYDLPLTGDMGEIIGKLTEMKENNVDQTELQDSFDAMREKVIMSNEDIQGKYPENLKYLGLIIKLT